MVETQKNAKAPAIRRQNFQNISWFLDLHRRELLDLEPPYQRRSVWNKKYREDFIDTILLNYPSPAIFLFSRVEESGTTSHEVVDGKQRLTTIFRFVNDEIPVGDNSQVTALQGKYFSSLKSDEKIAFYQYDFSVEYLPTNREEVINGIFDRLNRNVAKLSNQELRHAKFDGEFIKSAEDLAEWTEMTFGGPIARITDAGRRQMKDVEITATMLLFLEIGPQRLSVEEFEEAFSSRDDEWERRYEFETEFKTTMQIVVDLIKDEGGQLDRQSRFRHQADFYSLFAAVAEMHREGTFPASIIDAADRLRALDNELDFDPLNPATPRAVFAYLDAVKSGSHDTKQRRIRISITKHALAGKPLSDWKQADDSPSG